MFEILLKVSFFLSMLVVYANVTSTSSVIVIVAIYIACVFSYYYFDNIQAKIDEWFNHLNVNARLNDSTNPSHLSAYFVNRKFGKIKNTASPNTKKAFNPDTTFAPEKGPGVARSSIKMNGDLPSPIAKSVICYPRSAANVRGSPKLGTKEAGAKKKSPSAYGSMAPNQRYNTNLDLETFMNVNSPGFTSRVVNKATESASYHIKYPAVRQIPAYRFDKSTLRQLSKIPKANSPPAVRIAPPEPNNVDLLNSSNLVNESENESWKKNDYLRVLRDISRKRNYSQEEIDRNVTIPKKSRKNDAKNAVSSHYKRAHEDSSSDSIDDTNCKKRCDNVDRNYAKMMSFTSSMSVLVPEFSWSSTRKKRKSSRLEKSENESPGNIEKCRKIEEEMDESSNESECEKRTSELEVHSGESKKYEEEIKPTKNAGNVDQNTDEVNSFMPLVTGAEDSGEYIRVAGGKILNRTNRTYRKKLNSTKIDPVSVISAEPEYVSDTAYVDDKIMKENLLNNLMNDIERKGDKTDSVVFYQNSIIEEIEKKTTTVEVHRTDSSILTSSSFNPLLPPTTKPTNSGDQTDSSSARCNFNQNQPIVSLSSTVNPQPIFNSKTSVETSKAALDKPPEKTVMAADVPNSSPAAAPTSNALFQPPAQQTSNVNFSSAGAARFNIPVTESSKPNPPPFLSSPAPAFGPFGAAVSTPSNSSKSGNESPSVAVSASAVTFNHVEPQQKPAVDISCSPAPKSTPTSNSVATAPAPVTTTSCTSSFPAPSVFAVPKPVAQNPVTTFTFGSPSASTFKPSNNATSAPSQTSVFNAGAAASTPAQAVFGKPSNNANSAPSQTSAFNTGAAASTATQSLFGTTSTSSPSSVFGAPNQTSLTNPPVLSVFNASSQATSNAMPALPQSAPQTLIFGTSSTVPSTMNGFNSNSPTATATQPSVFGIAGLQSQSGAPSQGSSLFASSGDSLGNIFGQSQSTAPPVGVVNPLPQAAPQFGPAGNTAPPQFGAGNSSVRYSFGGISNQQAPVFTAQPAPAVPAPAVPAPTVVSMPPAFGAVPAALSTASAAGNATPQFSFSGPPSFGAAANTFNAISNNARPPANSTFNFGSNSSQPSQPAFQFGASNPAATANPPFMFGASAAPAASAAVGFSIGSGGSSSRNRPMARPRKAK